MNAHLTAEETARYADHEVAADALPRIEEHLHDCSRCSSGVIAALQLKQAIRESVPRYAAPRIALGELAGRAKLRDVSSDAAPPLRTVHPLWWAATAAVLVLLIASQLFVIGARRSASRELIDLHTTILGGTSPIEVVSTDRHTVKPWFEGRVPFAVNVPELGGTPFRLIGGRVVFWRGRPAAYLLLTKGAHRVSMFIYDGPLASGSEAMTVESWRTNGLSHVVVADLSPADLEPLRRAWVSAGGRFESNER